MSESSDTRCCVSDTELDAHWNDPGQDSLRYRIGTWSSFYSRLKYALSRYAVDDERGDEHRPLAALTTRATDDPTIGLLDAWSVTLDVLTFYQERIANEGFLRTATERQSVLYLARAIGYELSPGVAASTRLAFTVEDSAGAPGSATIAEGLAVLSIPGQDETPQTFETVASATVQAAWNAMTPVCWEDHAIAAGTTTAYIVGVSSRLQRGDFILIVGDERTNIEDSASSSLTDERWDVRVLTAVTTYPKDNYTHLEWADGLGHTDPESEATVPPASENQQIFTFRVRTPVFGYNAPPWLSLDEDSRVRWYNHYLGEAVDPTSGSEPGLSDYADFLEQKKWPGDTFKYIFAEYDPAEDDESSDPPGGGRSYKSTSEETWVDLDGEQKGVLEGSWVVFMQGNARELGKVRSVSIASRDDFALSGKVTRVELDTRSAQLAAEDQEKEGSGHSGGDAGDVDNEEFVADSLASFTRRRTLALAESEALSFSQKPISAPFPDETYDSDGYQLSAVVDGLEAGMYVFVTGELWDSATGAGTGETATELVEIESVSTAESTKFTTFKTVNALTNTYVRDTVTMNANVLLATHGETVSEEVLGSGDGSDPGLSFTLRKSPVTFVSAATVTGSESTLTLRVDGVQWSEVASLYDQADDAEIFILRIDDDAKATVSFGDGISGARVPTGTENVTVSYRYGIGDDGNVDADTLKLMKKRPLGVKAVTNPIEAKGGEDPETLADARDNAPLTVLTMDRLVSLTDYEDFARAFAGVAKARAFNVWAGEQRRVHLTIAGVDGAELAAGDQTYDNLLSAIKAYQDPTQRVEIKSCTYRYFRVRAELLVDEAYVSEDVFAAAKAALEEAFSFEQRAFAESVTAAQIISVLQAIPGVTAVDLNGLTLQSEGYDPSTGTADADESEAGAEANLSAVLLASKAKWNGTSVDPAELLLLDTSDYGVLLEEMN